MLPEQAHNLAMRITACTLSVPPLLFAAALSAQPTPNPQEIQFRVPMACAADATIRAAEYPEAIQVYDDGQPPRSYEEADRAALGLLWHHRRAFAEEVAVAAFRKLFDRPPTDDELRDEHSRWVRTLMGYPGPLNEAVAANCEALYEVADRSCPTPRGRTPVMEWSDLVACSGTRHVRFPAENGGTSGRRQYLLPAISGQSCPPPVMSAVGQKPDARRQGGNFPLSAMSRH